VTETTTDGWIWPKKRRRWIKWVIAAIGLGVVMSPVLVDLSGSHIPSGNPNQEAICDNAEIIFCDNFEDGAPAEESASGDYIEYNSDGGTFVRTAGVGFQNSEGMQITWGTSDTSGGWLILRFGQMPGSASPHRPTEDFTNIYWREYVKTGSGWSGNPTSNLKQSRVWILDSGGTAFGPQAMIAHLWSADSNNGTLMLDPARGTDTSGNVVTTSHNDIANLTFLGIGEGIVAVHSTGNADTWFCVETHVKLNTSQAVQDGIYEFWVDGVLQNRQTGLNWVSDYTDFGINVLQLENTWNSPGSPQVNSRVLDNVVVSTARIGCVSEPPAETQEAKWNADSLTIQQPSATCEGGALIQAIFDTGDKTEGTASMKVTYTGSQGDKGCKQPNIETLNIQHNSGDWLCQSWDMKFDPAFNWVGGQNKIKAHRILTSGSWTLYLQQGSLAVSECPECDNCPSGDNCTNLNYDFDPATNNAVESWHSYTYGIKLQTGGGNDDGEAKLWIDGLLIDSEANQTYCTSCSGAVQDGWGTFMMRSHPQTPTGTLWLDDYLTTSSSSECVARS